MWCPSLSLKIQLLFFRHSRLPVLGIALLDMVSSAFPVSLTAGCALAKCVLQTGRRNVTRSLETPQSPLCAVRAVDVLCARTLKCVIIQHRDQLSDIVSRYVGRP
jgi:hypothetical protein